MIRCPLTKTAMINLIKAGAFDEIDTAFNNRKEIMVYYILQNCDAKKRLTLQNFNGLVQHDLIPKELEMQIRIFNFNKYLKAYKKHGQNYLFDDACMQFFEKFLNDYLDCLTIENGVAEITQTKWDKIYQKYMDVAREWLKENQDEILKEYNKVLFKEVWDKYASGNESHWEMDSLCFYYGKHELINVDNNKYGIVDFKELSPVPDVEYYFKRGGKQIPIYKLRRIAGTVLAKDDNRCSVILLTTTGVVPVKMSRDQYALYKKQISEVQPDNSKKVIEKSWFKRGRMLLITGYRLEDTFKMKTYANTEGHQIYLIEEVVGNKIKLRHDRYSGKNIFEEEDYE